MEGQGRTDEIRAVAALLAWIARLDYDWRIGDYESIVYALRIRSHDDVELCALRECLL